MEDTNEVSPSPSNSYRVEHAWDGTVPPSVAVVEAVAAATDTEPRALPSLQRRIETEAIDAMLTDGRDASLRVTFEYEGTTVVVDQDGSIEVVLRSRA